MRWRSRRRRRVPTFTSMPSRLRARLHDFDGLRQHVVGDVEHVRLRLADALQQRHRFGGGGGFVEQRRVRDREARQVDDHLLEVQQRFQTALRNLRLIRRVGRVPRRIFQHVAQDHAPACACRNSPGRCRFETPGSGPRACARTPALPPRSSAARRATPAAAASLRRIDSGITASINAARVAKPSASSIARWSAESGPMCRSANASWHSSAASDRDERFIRRSGCSSFM